MVQIHPVIAEILGPSPEEYAALLSDVQKRGQEIPIVLHEGMIWDGRARWRACRELGKDPWLVPLRRGDASTHYIKANIRRLGAARSAERGVFVETIGRVYGADHLAEISKARRAWLSVARAEFETWERSPRQPCSVCGSHLAFVHAHHSFPLALQWECGVPDAIHDHQWLCPTHHKDVHALLSGYLLGARDLNFLDQIFDDAIDEWLKIEKVAQVGINLCCEVLGGGEGKKGRFDPPYAMFVLRNAASMFPWPRPPGW